jgi:hypothetical protein
LPVGLAPAAIMRYYFSVIAASELSEGLMFDKKGYQLTFKSIVSRALSVAVLSLSILLLASCSKT